MPPYQTKGERDNQCVTGTYKVNPPTDRSIYLDPHPQVIELYYLKS